MTALGGLTWHIYFLSTQILKFKSSKQIPSKKKLETTKFVLHLEYFERDAALKKATHAPLNYVNLRVFNYFLVDLRLVF